MTSTLARVVTTETDAAEPLDPTTPAPRALRRRRLRIPPLGLALSWLVVATVIAWALVPWLFTGQDPYQTVNSGGLLPPSWQHPFGTDSVGRDQLARVIYGARESLLGALVAVTVGFVVGVILGVVSGSIGGILDEAIMRFVDVLLSVPGLLLALTVVVLLGPGTVNAAIAVGIGSIAGFARIVRSEVVQVRRTDYVEAAFASGGRFFTVLWRHVLPNSLRPVIALTALQFGSAILALSTLGFLGYGVTPPDPEWGMIIAQGRNLLGAAWWITTFPGLVILVVVLSANRISRSLGAKS